MNLRHAAALALVGWYLISPPATGQDFPRSRDEGAPLSKWFFYNELKNDVRNRNDRAQAMEFQTAEECEAKKEEKWPAHPPPIPHRRGRHGRENKQNARRGREESLRVFRRSTAQRKLGHFASPNSDTHVRIKTVPAPDSRCPVLLHSGKPSA